MSDLSFLVLQKLMMDIVEATIPEQKQYPGVGADARPRAFPLVLSPSPTTGNRSAAELGEHIRTHQQTLLRKRNFLKRLRIKKK